LSVTVAGVHVTTRAIAEPLGVVVITMLVGHTITGAVWSNTSTENRHTAVLPASSRAVYTTSVRPIANAVPDDGATVSDGDGVTLSVTSGADHVTIAVAASLATIPVWLPGHALNTGASVSRTITKKSHVA